MAYNIEQISAKLEIQDLCFRYAQIIDANEFDKLDEVFTEDAFIDYSAMGGSRGNLEETKKFLASALPVLFHGSET